MIQVLTKLLSNAIKFTPDGQRIIISFSQETLPIGRREGDEGNVAAIAVKVADQGIGIPEDGLETVFDKFIQSSKAKNGAGGARARTCDESRYSMTKQELS
jgi:signal transduction histidine kinase